MGRFGADISLLDLFVDLASCDRRLDFTRPRSVHDLTARLRVYGV